jgi:hypothetical protein
MVTAVDVPGVHFVAGPAGKIISEVCCRNRTEYIMMPANWSLRAANYMDKEKHHVWKMF